MKKHCAIILAGGKGTRLVPFTINRSKPSIKFINTPIIIYQINKLLKFGIEQIFVTVRTQDEIIYKELLKDYKKVQIILESVECGTGGPLSNLRMRVKGYDVFILNGDIVSHCNLNEMVDFHRQKKADCSILTIKVEDYKRFGIVEKESDGRIVGFWEKPSTFIGDNANGGVYLCSDEFFNDLPRKSKFSLENDFFPVFAENKRMFAFEYLGIWADLGTPISFIEATIKFIKDGKILEETKRIESINRDKNTYISKYSVIGENSSLGKDSKIINSIIFEGVVVEEGVLIENSIIGPFCQLKKNCIVKNCYLGDNTMVGGDFKLIDTKSLNNVVFDVNKTIL